MPSLWTRRPAHIKDRSIQHRPGLQDNRNCTLFLAKSVESVGNFFWIFLSGPSCASLSTLSNFCVETHLPATVSPGTDCWWAAWHFHRGEGGVCAHKPHDHKVERPFSSWRKCSPQTQVVSVNPASSPHPLLKQRVPLGPRKDTSKSRNCRSENQGCKSVRPVPSPAPHPCRGAEAPAWPALHSPPASRSLHGAGETARLPTERTRPHGTARPLVAEVWGAGGHRKGAWEWEAPAGLPQASGQRARGRAHLAPRGWEGRGWGCRAAAGRGKTPPASPRGRALRAAVFGFRLFEKQQ